MSKEANEEETIHSVSIDLEGSSSATRKKIRPSKSGEKERMISSMKEVAESLKEFVKVTKKKMKNKKKMEIKEAQEVVHEVVKREAHQKIGSRYHLFFFFYQQKYYIYKSTRGTEKIQR